MLDAVESVAAPPRQQPSLGLLDDDELRAVLGKSGKPISPRTLERYISDGMPFTRLGARRLFDLEEIRAWVLGRTRRYIPRSPGRPRKR